MTSNDNNQNKGQEKYVLEAYILHTYVYVSVRVLTVSVFGELMPESFIRTFIICLLLCVPLFSSFVSFSFSLLHHFILFYFIFILWFIFISIQINILYSQLFAIFLLLSSISSRSLCVCATFCYILKWCFFLLFSKLVLFSSSAFHQAGSENILWNMTQQLWRRRIILKTASYHTI